MAGEFDEGTEDDEDDETNKAGLERPSTPPQRKRTQTLVSRTPTKPVTPSRPPPPRASISIEEDPYELPASTAPARLAPDGRSRRERVRDWPLKVCDGTTVNSENLVVSAQVFPCHVLENIQVHFNPEQKWYYLRDQRPDELWLFKQGGSRSDNDVHCGSFY